MTFQFVKTLKKAIFYLLLSINLFIKLENSAKFLDKSAFLRYTLYIELIVRTAPIKREPSAVLRGRK